MELCYTDIYKGKNKDICVFFLTLLFWHHSIMSFKVGLKVRLKHFKIDILPTISDPGDHLLFFLVWSCGYVIITWSDQGITNGVEISYVAAIEIYTTSDYLKFAMKYDFFNIRYLGSHVFHLALYMSCHCTHLCITYFTCYIFDSFLTYLIQISTALISFRSILHFFH